MIVVNISIDRFGFVRGYTVKGHSNFAQYGEDIVCAAVSVLAQTALNSMVEVCGVDENKIDYSIDDEIGYLEMNLPSGLDEVVLDKTQIVLKVFELGIKSIIESYPKYVTLKYREV